MMTSMGSFGSRHRGSKSRVAASGEMRATNSPGSRRCYLVTVDGRKFRGSLDDGAGGCFPGLLVGPVLAELLQLVVDPVAEHGVVLLQADAVGLLGEGFVRGQLEGVRFLVHETGEDHVVRGHGFDLLVAQRLEAGGV